MGSPQRRFPAVLALLSTAALAVQAVLGASDLIFFLAPLILLGSLLLSGRYVGEERIARRYAAARSRPRRRSVAVAVPRSRDGAVALAAQALGRSPLTRRGPPASFAAAA